MIFAHGLVGEWFRSSPSIYFGLFDWPPTSSAGSQTRPFAHITSIAVSLAVMGGTAEEVLKHDWALLDEHASRLTTLKAVILGFRTREEMTKFVEAVATSRMPRLSESGKLKFAIKQDGAWDGEWLLVAPHSSIFTRMFGNSSYHPYELMITSLKVLPQRTSGGSKYSCDRLVALVRWRCFGAYLCACDSSISILCNETLSVSHCHSYLHHHRHPSPPTARQSQWYHTSLCANCLSLVQRLNSGSLPHRRLDSSWLPRSQERRFHQSFLNAFSACTSRLHIGHRTAWVS